MVTSVYDAVYACAQDQEVRARILHGYGGVPQDRVDALYPDAVQESALSVSAMSPTDPGLPDAVVKYAREWIGKQLVQVKAHVKNGPACTPKDYPEEFLRTRTPKSRRIYSTFSRRGITEAAMACGVSAGAVRIELYRIRVAYEMWTMRIPYDRVVEANLRKTRDLWGDIYAMHIRDGMTAGQIAKDLGVPQQDISNILRTVRRRMPYGGLRAPKDVVRLRFRSPRTPQHNCVTQAS